MCSSRSGDEVVATGGLVAGVVAAFDVSATFADEDFDLRLNNAIRDLLLAGGGPEIGRR